jgi:hypothetical protein
MQLLHCFTLQGASARCTPGCACMLDGYMLSSCCSCLCLIRVRMVGKFICRANAQHAKAKGQQRFPCMQPAAAGSFMQAQLPKWQSDPHAATYTRITLKEPYLPIFCCTAPVAAGSACKSEGIARCGLPSMTKIRFSIRSNNTFTGLRVLWGYVWLHFASTHSSWKVAFKVDPECRVKAG